MILIKDAIYVEQELLNEAVGIQDQIAVASGGINKIMIDKDGSFRWLAAEHGNKERVSEKPR